jgi:hypothetical protein
MRLHWLVPSLIALALGVFHPRSVHAQAEVSSTAVLGLEGIDVPATLTDEMSDQLRQRVSATRDLHLVSGKDLVEVKLVFGCADEAANCMAQAGKSLDAEKLIYGSVKRLGEDYAIWLKMLDVRRAKIDFWLTETLPKRNADVAGIRAASARWLAKLTGRPVDAGTIQVTSNVNGAVVSMDGVPLGATGEQPLTIADVAPGRHDLVASKAGYSAGKQQFIVGAGQTVPVNLTLSQPPAAPAAALADGLPRPPAPAAEMVQRAPGPAADAQSGSEQNGYRTGFWVTLAGGLVSAGAAVKFGLDVSDVNKKLDPYRRFPCMGSQLCDAKGVVRPALTTTEKSKVSALNDDGNRNQTLQWICIGVGSVLGVTGGYLFYKGYIDSDEEHARREARRGLRIFPTAAASSGGIVAEFDF